MAGDAYNGYTNTGYTESMAGMISNLLAYSRAVEIYHNRQLDGKPMKCTMVGVNKWDAIFLPHSMCIAHLAQ